MSRRFLPARRGRWIGLVLVALLAWRLQRHAAETAPENLPAGQLLAAGDCQVQRVIDGDTLLLAGGYRVRLIGVDTPETVKPNHPFEAWGPEATAFTSSFIGVGTTRLEFDRERLDVHGRWLAYVWVGDRLLNEELLRAGLARYEPGFHYSETMKRRFRRAADEARQGHRGIWSAAGSTIDLPAAAPVPEPPDAAAEASAE